MSRTMKSLLGVWIAVLAAAAGWIAWDATRGGQPSIGGPFTLVDNNGRTVTEATFKGKPTILYFGYTYCPDACPAALLLAATAIEQLGTGADRKINVLFVTIDPERDTLPLMRDYVGNFGENFLGLTGTPEQIAAAARAFRVYYQKVPSKDGATYLMDHSSILYVLDRNGRFVTHFTHESKVEAVAAALGRLL